MKSLFILGALAALGSARPQDIEWDVVDSAADPPSVVVPIGAQPQAATYNPDAAASSAAAEISEDPLPQVSEPAKQEVNKRNNPCSPQPTGSGPVPSPDTASSFLSYAPFAAAASSAPVPSGYRNTFTNLKASNSAYGYMGNSVLSSYSSTDCAAECNNRVGCSAFNIYFERDPTVVSRHNFIRISYSNHRLGARSRLHKPRQHHGNQVCLLGWSSQPGKRKQRWTVARSVRSCHCRIKWIC
jgi:hypothetical protein